MTEDQYREHIPKWCGECGGPRNQARIDVTTHADLAACRRSYVDGRWDQCRQCGSIEEPVRRVEFCAWCPTPINPDPRSHPGGQASHQETIDAST